MWLLFLNNYDGNIFPYISKTCRKFSLIKWHFAANTTRLTNAASMLVHRPRRWPHNYIIISMDKGGVTALTLLDLSAAFDTIDYTTLTDRLSDWYGISGQAQI